MPMIRANPHLAEMIEILDEHYAKFSGRPDQASEARDRLSKTENEWIDDEVFRCLIEPRYFISNYYAVRTEDKGFQGLYPFFDSQEILHDEYRRLEREHGKVRALVLKARQMGSTTYNCAEFFHKTIFKEHANSIIVGQDEGQSQFIMGMYESALDFLPWWMKPRIKVKQTGSQINFDEKDEQMRAVRPGLKSWIYADNANKPTGVGRGKTLNRALLSELSFWANGSQLSKSLFPTMNTADGFYIMESTANGRNNFWHNLWRRAEAGKIDWNPIFIPFYRREKTYSLPIRETQGFVLTTEEKEMRIRIETKENFVIKDEVFNWMRSKKEEFVATDGDDTLFSQEYTSEPEESFQTSAVTAFPRGIIRRMSKLTKNPHWVGEITYDFNKQAPVLRMKQVDPTEDLVYPEIGNRLHIFEKPIHGEEYTIGIDIALGNPGGDYSCAQVVKKGKAWERAEQVAVWHGHINPEAMAEIALALGWYYNEALVAIEVNSYGMQTNSTLMRNYEYTNIYRYKKLDRITNFMTNIVGFLSTPSSTDALMAKMSEFFLEDRIIINCRFTMDEFNDYTENGAEGEGAHDDYVDALLIAIYCGHEMEIRQRQEGSRKPRNEGNSFKIKDRFNTIIAETTSQSEAERIAKKNVGSMIERTSSATADVTLNRKKFKVPSDFQNTEFSSIHDGTGSAHRLAYEEGVEPEDITPELIAQFEDEQEDMENSDEEAWKYT